MKCTKSIMARIKIASDKQLLNLYRLVSREIDKRGLNA